MVVFQFPQWLFLVPVLLLTGWYWKGLQLWRPLRALALFVLVLILADPQINRTARGMDLWALVDRSESASALSERGLPEWRRLLEQSRPSRFDRIRWVSFSGEAVEQTGYETHDSGGSGPPHQDASRHRNRAGLALLRGATPGCSCSPMGSRPNRWGMWASSSRARGFRSTIV